MRTHRRTRHEVGLGTLRVLRVAFRYSRSRDAYVLRGVGNRFGPVVRRREVPAARAAQRARPVDG